MSLDELALSAQRAVDRLIRRLRRGAAPTPTHRRFLVVQIDGLSRAVLEEALASGRMPFLARLLERHDYRLEPMAVGLPTSTAAFHMAAMYGVRPDIPGFHYYEWDRRGDIHFPRSGHAAAVEAKQAAGRRGILHGGSAYGCVFTGSADNNLFSFASLTRPKGASVLNAFSAFVVAGWVFVKSLTQTIIEVARAGLRFIADPLAEVGRWRWLTIKIGISVWVRQFFTLAVARDLYAGTPRIYVNYLDYDVAAHAFGPGSRRAMQSLRRVDSAIRQLWRVARRVPEHQYDLYVLSDHGQALCLPYRNITGGRRLERWIVDELLGKGRAQAPPPSPSGLVEGIRGRRRGTRGLFQHFLNYIDEDFLRRRDHEAYERDGVRVISAGPNAFLYVLDTAAALHADALDRRFPGLAEELSKSPGIGFVLARSDHGPLCFWRGERYQLGDAEPGPFAGRADAPLVLQGIADLMAMPSAGDLVIYGIDASGGHVSFIPEVGAHAGPSPEEMHTFIVCSAKQILPLPITHPVQLYEHFMQYQSGQAASG